MKRLQTMLDILITDFEYYSNKHRASPVANNCQTLIDATSTLSVSLFNELLESRVTSEDASLVFRISFRFSDPNLCGF